ncbi:hypothetical protein M408DRAFT_213208 [Serendipita vermifera MAFF 305830]|uniref:Uncharacterized protein n=1 Tax=Serendipita vermifera MAFF 305830 TaxID=933852 RepID=A0A0C2XT62_SERVB|nr:hypothetical protein M408DRAFT_213208 [Serendipita vermifera MAFF 305830]
MVERYSVIIGVFYHAKTQAYAGLETFARRFGYVNRYCTFYRISPASSNLPFKCVSIPGMCCAGSMPGQCIPSKWLLSTIRVDRSPNTSNSPI